MCEYWSKRDVRQRRVVRRSAGGPRPRRACASTRSARRASVTVAGSCRATGCSRSGDRVARPAPRCGRSATCSARRTSAGRAASFSGSKSASSARSAGRRARAGRAATGRASRRQRRQLVGRSARARRAAAAAGRIAEVEVAAAVGDLVRVTSSARSMKLAPRRGGRRARPITVSDASISRPSVRAVAIEDLERRGWSPGAPGWPAGSPRSAPRRGRPARCRAR